MRVVLVVQRRNAVTKRLDWRRLTWRPKTEEVRVLQHRGWIVTGVIGAAAGLARADDADWWKAVMQPPSTATPVSQRSSGLKLESADAIAAPPPAPPLATPSLASDSVPTPFIHNRDSIPDRPPVVFPFDGRFEMATRADVGGSPGSVSVQRSGLAGNVVIGPEHDLQISLPVDWETSTYSFRNAGGLFPGGTDRFRNAQQIVFSPDIEAKVSDHWGVFAGALLIDAGQYGADSTTTYGGFGGVIWRPDKSFTLRFGLGARTQLEDDVQALPAIWMEWKIDERTRLTSQGNNIRFEYDINRAWCIKLDAAYETRAYRLDSDGPGPRAVFRDNQVPVTARIEFVPHAATRFEAWVGANLSREFTVDLTKDVRYSRSHAAPSIVFGVSFEIIF
jgi:hypothetical protein